MEEILLLQEACKTQQTSTIERLLKRTQDINRPGLADSAPLHLAVWRNHASITEALLAAGANPNQPDGESGWTPIHKVGAAGLKHISEHAAQQCLQLQQPVKLPLKALYFGHLGVARLLIRSGSSLESEDLRGRSPLDLLSKELACYMQLPCRVGATANTGADASASGPYRGVLSGSGRVNTFVSAWGSGSNFQLGTGSTDFAETPVRVDELADLGAVQLVAAKFHSAAVSADGRLWVWGWGRGGRLGHPDHVIHSGETALIHPWPVAGLGKRQVVSVAAAKHHMLVATTAGEVWSWGSNRDGKLGYAGTDTQPTPKKVAALQKLRVVAVAASNKHSAALTSAGELYTWGANSWGQLGYGTSDSASNPTPRLVEALKGKRLTAVDCAKHHTVVLTAEGDPWTWGFQRVTCTRVQLAGARDCARSKAGGAAATDAGGPLRFHRGHTDVTRPVAVMVAAGHAHTSVLTRTGTVLTWRSNDPHLKVQEVLGPLGGKRAVHISAGKTRTAVVTDTGDVYEWDAKPFMKKAAGGGDPSGSGRQEPEGLGTGAQRGGAGEGASSSSQLSSSLTNRGDSGSMPIAAAAALKARAGKGGQAQGQAPVEPMQWVRPARVPGLKRVTQVVVGEKHSLALSCWSVPHMPDVYGNMLGAGATPTAAAGSTSRVRRGSRGSDSDSDTSTGPGLEAQSPVASAMYVQAADAMSPVRSRPAPSGLPLGCTASPGRSAASSDAGAPSFGMQFEGEWQQNSAGATQHQQQGPVESLQVIAQRVVAQNLVEPRTVLQILEYADVAGAQLLRSFCIAVALRNLDLVLVEALPSLYALPQHLLAELEHHYKAWLQPPPQQQQGAGHRGASQPGQQQGSARRSSSPQGMRAEGRRTTEGSSHVMLGSSPPLGSSPISGSWVERFSSQYLQQRQQQAEGSADTGAAGNSSSGSVPLASMPELSARRRRQLCKLQLPRRPTSVPAWLDGQTPGDLLLPSVGTRVLADVRQAALAAIGHSASPQQANIRKQDSESSAGFTAQDSAVVAQAVAGGERLLRTVQKKLQQVGQLEERLAAQGSHSLDAQQMAKLGSKPALLEAFEALQAGVPWQEVQDRLQHAQEVAAKLAAAADAGSSAVGTGAGHQGSSSKPRQSSGPAAGHTGSSKKQDSVSSSSTQQLSLHQQQQSSDTARGTSTPVQKSSSSPGPNTLLPLSEAAAASSSASRLIAASTPPAPGTRPGVAAGGGASSGSKEKSAPRKGDLSAFLSGALDAAKYQQQQKAAAAAAAASSPAAAAAPKAPAWGGVGPAMMVQPLGTLRELLGPQVAVGSISAAAGGAGQAAVPQQGPAIAPVTPGPLLGTPATKSRPVSLAPHTPPPGYTPRAASGLPPLSSPLTPSPYPMYTDPSPSPSGGSTSGTMKLSLADFMAKPKPVPAAAPKSAVSKEPAWSSSAVLGSSPTTANLQQRSLRDIQAEQEQMRAGPAGWGAAASSRTASGSQGAKPGVGVGGSSAMLGSSPPASKWYVPEHEQAAKHPHSLRNIETEEVAMKQLQKLYGKKVSITPVSRMPSVGTSGATSGGKPQQQPASKNQ